MEIRIALPDGTWLKMKNFGKAEGLSDDEIVRLALEAYCEKEPEEPVVEETKPEE